jgi:hypothetical protein
MPELPVTIVGVPFERRLYHFVLLLSRWEHANIVEGDETCEALSMGLQGAVAASGRSHEHRSDSPSATFGKLQDEADCTVRYAALLDH